MSDQDEKPKCDIDDLMCQVEMMTYLQGMQRLLGSDKFQERYPELADVGSVVTERVQQQTVTIKEAFARCGLVPPTEEEIHVEAHAVIETEEQTEP